MRVVSDEYKKEIMGEASSANSEPELEPSHESRLEEKELSRRERGKLIKEHFLEETKDMDKAHKFEHFFLYYKWYILVPIFVVLIIVWISLIVYSNTRPIGLSYVILNSYDQDKVNRDFYDEYFSYHQLSNKNQEISDLNYYIDYDYYIQHESTLISDSNSNYYIFSNNCDKGDYDIVITDRSGLDYCCHIGIIKPLSEYFDQDTYNKISSYTISVKDYYGDTLPYAIDISNTDFARELSTGYTEMYVIFPGVTDRNYKNACRFIEYLLGTNKLK